MIVSVSFINSKVVNFFLFVNILVVILVIVLSLKKSFWKVFKLGLRNLVYLEFFLCVIEKKRLFKKRI